MHLSHSKRPAAQRGMPLATEFLEVETRIDAIKEGPVNLRLSTETSRRSTSLHAVFTGRFESGHRYDLCRRLRYLRLSKLSNPTSRPTGRTDGRPESPIHHLSPSTPVRRSVMNRVARIALALLSFNALFVATFATELISVAKVLS